MGVRNDPVYKGQEDDVQPGTNHADSILFRQQDRVILPGTKGVAQEGDGGQDLGQFQISSCGGI